MNIFGTVVISAVVALAMIIVMNTHCTDIFKPFGGDKVCVLRVP